MLIPLLSASLVLLPQGATSRPSSQPTSRPAALTDAERLVEADWGEGAPGQQVVRREGVDLKFLPMRSPQYGGPKDVADRVRDEDLVVGLVVDGRAFAYPINMLGGPQREIVNDEYGGVAFCVNW